MSELVGHTKATLGLHLGYTWATLGLHLGCAGRRIADQRAARVAVGRQQIGKPRWQLIEIDRRSKKHVERRILEQREGGSKPAAMRPARAMGGRDLADLARDDAQPAAGKGFAVRHGDLTRTVPAQLHDCCLLTRKPERGGQTLGGGAGVKYEVAVAWRLCGCGEAGAEHARQRGPLRRDIDERDLCRWHARA